MANNPSTLNRITQVGVESAPGDFASPTIKLASLSIDSFQENPEIQTHRVTGALFPTIATENRNWMSADVSGGFSFDEVQYPFSSVFGASDPAPTELVVGTDWAASTDYVVDDYVRPTDGTDALFVAIVGGTSGTAEPTWPANEGDTVVDGSVTWENTGYSLSSGAYEWNFAVNRDMGAIQSYAIYQGDPTLDPDGDGTAEGDADRGSNTVFNAFNVSSARDGEMSVGGELMGAFEGPGPISESGVSELPVQPGTPNMVNLYIDDTYAGIGTTKVEDNFEVNPSIGDRFGQKWIHDADKKSFDAHIPGNEPSAEVTATLSKWSGGGLSRLVRALRAGQKKYMRMEVIGPEIYPTINYLLQWDMVVMISDTPSPDDRDGNYVSELTMTGLEDADLGSGFKVKLVNSRSTL